PRPAPLRGPPSPRPAGPRRSRRRVGSGHSPSAYLYGTVLTDASDLHSIIHTTPYGRRNSVRLPNSTHESRPWRIREIAHDFELEDVWALPVEGSAEDFETLLELMVSADPAELESLP